MAHKILDSYDRLWRGKFVLPSPAEVAKARFTAAQLADWGISWPPPHGWRAELARRYNETGGQKTSTGRVAQAGKILKPKFRNKKRPCDVCGLKRETVVITVGLLPEGFLKVRTFCSPEHAAEAGFPWAGR